MHLVSPVGKIGNKIGNSRNKGSPYGLNLYFTLLAWVISGNKIGNSRNKDSPYGPNVYFTLLTWALN